MYCSTFWQFYEDYGKVHKCLNGVNEAALPVTELGSVLAFFRLSRRSKRASKVSGLLAS